MKGEKMNNNFRLLTIGLVLIVVTFFLGLYLLNQNWNETPNEISALEGRDIANQIAFNWSENYTLVYVVGNPQQAFAFRYWDLTNNTSNCLVVTIYTNQTSEIEYSKHLFDEYPINNWTIDSNEAQNIALANNEINAFMKHNPTLDSFFLATPYPNSNSVWYLEWCYNAGFDDPKWAQIQIDANTGEVLYVEADN